MFDKKKNNNKMARTFFGKVTLGLTGLYLDTTPFFNTFKRRLLE